MGENMPLVSKGDEPESAPNGGLAFRMNVVGAPDIEQIWVVITSECLSSLNIAAPRDQFGGVKIFELHRRLIEGAASAKFDRQGVNPADGNRDGAPIITIFSGDMPKV
jgi:hypothetical protein